MNMKKTAIATAILLASGAAQSATLTAGTTYEMAINSSGSCFAFGDCTTLPENVTAGSVITIATTDDGAGGVDFTVTSADDMFYTDTPGGLFSMTQIGGSGSVDADGNISYTPTGRLGAAATFAYLGTPAWNIDDVSPNQAPGYVGFTSGTMSNFAFTTQWDPNLTLSGSALDDSGNATIVSVSNIGTAWGPFANTAYSEVWSVIFH